MAATETDVTDLVLACLRAHSDLEVAELSQQRAVLRAKIAGASWGMIGRALGVSAQAVQQRYGRFLEGC